MGVQSNFDNAARALTRSPEAHPYAIPPIPGGWGLWLVRRGDEPPLGYIVRRDKPERENHCYAHCRDSANKRPWLHQGTSLNSAVAHMIQTERDIRKLIGESSREPESWPPPASQA